MENGWQRWALGITVGILMGGGGSAIYGNSQARAMEDRLNAKIIKLEGKVDRRSDVINDMAKSLARMEVEIRHIREALDD